MYTSIVLLTKRDQIPTSFWLVVFATMAKSGLDICTRFGVYLYSRQNASRSIRVGVPKWNMSQNGTVDKCQVINIKRLINVKWMNI